MKAKEHMRRVSMLHCMVCGAWPPSSVHHILEGRYGQRKASDFDTIPLCYNHHQGKEGIHTIGAETWRKRYGSEIEMVEKVKKLLETF